MNPELRKPSAGGWAALAGLLLAFLLLALVTYSHLGEDAFISFRYARNLAEGHGLVFNEGDRVEGYSNLLWVLATVPFELLGIRIDIGARVLSTGLFSALIAGGWWAARRLSHVEDPWWVVWWLPLALAVEPLLHYHDDRGLETVPYAAILGGAILVIGAGGSILFAAILAAMATLTRPEGIGFALALLPAVAARELWRPGLRPRDPAAWRPLLLFAAIPAGAFLAQLAFRLFYYGEWVPNTMIAKRASGLGYGPVLSYTASRTGVPVIGFVGALLALRSEKLRPLAVATLGMGAAAVLFQLRAGSLLNEGFRYLVPLFVPSVIGVWLLVAFIAERLEIHRGASTARTIAAMVTLLVFLPMPFTIYREGSALFRGNTDAPRSRFHARLIEKETWDLGERVSWYLHEPIFINAEAGRWVANNLPSGAVIAGDQLGQFGYYAGRGQTVLDLMGLMDRDIARRGLSVQYLGLRRPHYLVAESALDTDFWPREWRLKPTVPSLRPVFDDPEFAKLYRPRWLLKARLSFSQVGFMVYVRRDLDDGRPLEEVFIGVEEAEFERRWRVLSPAQ